MIIKSRSGSVGRTRAVAVGIAVTMATTMVAAAWSGTAAQSPGTDITIALVLNDLTNPVSAPLRKGARGRRRRARLQAPHQRAGTADR